MKVIRLAFTGVALVAMLITAMSVAASAGEITGKGKRPMVVDTYDIVDEEGNVVGEGQILHARSECAFSGLNDDYLIEQPVEGPASDGFGRTQSWGQLPKEVRDEIGQFGAHPGQSCNPNGSGPVEP